MRFLLVVVANREAEKAEVVIIIVDTMQSNMASRLALKSFSPIPFWRGEVLCAIPLGPCHDDDRSSPKTATGNPSW